ncbi:serine carboxypeptidase S28 [Apodospora peruviana]|uniref:Serine carboxypeptidase S28 n=1 Tax=Apodospora peruviana TaxID=516989 RepID=A0AAE0IKL3_9PEZI|nr:serine carboxypeptidase S28 [Apodospora peruviana]
MRTSDMASSFVPYALVLFSLIRPITEAAQLWPHLTPPPLAAAISAGPVGGNATFEQLIDHSNPSLGTFSQRYWWNTSYWAGPGSPVLLFTPGETRADTYTGYLTNKTIMGLYAQAIGAAIILFEHRYWGESSPFQYLDTKNLSYLTLENSIQDIVRFAREVELPFDKKESNNAPHAPWINVGGSYSGALAAWMEKLAPGTFWAYHASSGPVQAVYDYWSYFLPIQRGMPANCSADISLIVDYVDSVLDKKNETETAKLKDMFGLGEVVHDDDFAGALVFPLGSWQGIQLYSNYSQFFQMCDTIEGVRAVDINNNGTNKPVDNSTLYTVPGKGVGLEKALVNFASWFKHELLPDTCSMYNYNDWNDTNSVGCFDTYNTTSPFITDWSVNNTFGRQWYWMTCNEPFFYWQTGAPKDTPSIASRYVTAEYYQRQCDLLFPPQDNVTFGSAAGKTAETLNALTGGWDYTNSTRLIWINGEFDPWRSASVSSELRPGGPLKSTPEVPVFLLPGARHCNDLSTKNADANADLRKAHGEMIVQMKEWVGEFYKQKV